MEQENFKYIILPECITKDKNLTDKEKNIYAKVHIELGDFIPLVEFAGILEIHNIDSKSRMYQDIEELYKNEVDLKSDIQKFFEKYVKLL